MKIVKAAGNDSALRLLLAVGLLLVPVCALLGRFSAVLLEFDSHENVVKNYQGSYFYRMR